MEILDFATLRVIWWLFVGVLLIGFAIMDGHDMGVATLLPFLGKNDEERVIIVNTVGAHWEGNQVWFITAGGAIFAAWPLVYATAFSGFYWAMMAVLWVLFFRPVGFKYRGLLKNKTWRYAWDWCLFLGSFVPPIIFGVAFGNLLLGVPFHFDDTMRSFYGGSFWALLNPFALLCGLVSAAMVTLQGATYLMHRTVGNLYYRSARAVQIFAIASIVLFTLAGLWIAFGVDGYVVSSGIDVQAPSKPLSKVVAMQEGAWLLNYQRWPLTMLVPVLAYIGFAGALVMANKEKTLLAFVFSSLGLTGVIGTAGVSMFPFLMPSSSHLNSSLTLWDSTSSHLTLFVMLFVVLIFLPIVVSYTSWAYAVMRGKVTAEYIRENSGAKY